MHPVWMVTASLAADDARDAVPEADGYTNSYAIGAGAFGFVGRSLDLQPPSAVAWSVRYGWLVGRNLEWEVAYVGATDGAERPSLVTLVETDLKVDVIGRARVHPFFGAGVGYGAFAGHDAGTVTTPVFAGLAYDLGNVVVAARLVGRPTFWDEAAFTALGADSWAATIDLVSRY